MDPIRIDDSPGNDANTNPKIVALSDGDFIVLYDKNRGEAGVLGQRFNAKGEEVGDAFRVFSGFIGDIGGEALSDNRIAVSFEMRGTTKTEILTFDDAVTLGSADDDDLRGKGDTCDRPMTFRGLEEGCHGVVRSVPARLDDSVLDRLIQRPRGGCGDIRQ